MFLYELGSKSRGKSNLFDQFFIIKRDSKPLCNFATDTAATAAKLSADGNDLSFHVYTSLIARDQLLTIIWAGCFLLYAVDILPSPMIYTTPLDEL